MKPESGARAQGLHVAIIMDGNGRWATIRGRRREWGHRQGAKAVRKVVEAAPRLGITTLTLYAFSADNWSRPSQEVGLLMKLFRRYLRTETAELRASGVGVRVVGRRDRLDADLIRIIEDAEMATAGGEKLLLRLAIDYSSRDMLVRALCEAGARANGVHNGNELPRTNGNGSGGALDQLERADVARLLGRVMNDAGPSPDVDLLIRTGGEQRLSDFMLWECAYAELLFTPRMWPDFDGADLEEAVRDFASRERRFGTVALAV